jgi:hypothetical protein
MKMDRICKALMLLVIASIPWVGWPRSALSFVMLLVWIKERWICNQWSVISRSQIAKGASLFFLVFVVGSWYSDVSPDILVYHFESAIFPLGLMLFMLPFFQGGRHRDSVDAFLVGSIALLILMMDLTRYHFVTHFASAWFAQLPPQSMSYIAACALYLALEQTRRSWLVSYGGRWSILFSLFYALVAAYLALHIFVLLPVITGVATASVMVGVWLFHHLSYPKRGWAVLAWLVLLLGLFSYVTSLRAYLFLQIAFMMHIYGVFFDLIQQAPLLGHGTSMLRVLDPQTHRLLPGSVFLDIPLQLGILGCFACAYWFMMQACKDRLDTCMPSRLSALLLGCLAGGVFCSILSEVSGLIYAVLMASALPSVVYLDQPSPVIDSANGAS